MPWGPPPCADDDALASSAFNTNPCFVPQAYDARRAARDAEREAQEAAQEEEIRAAAEERRRREEEEAAKWMHMFTVEAAGEDALSQEAGQVRKPYVVAWLPS